MFEPWQKFDVGLFGSTSEPTQFLDSHVNSLRLFVRPRKTLRWNNVETVRQLIAKSADELLEFRNFGYTSLRNVRERLAEHGLKLRLDP